MKTTNSAKRIQELLDYYNISQSDFSRRTGLTRSTVSLYVSGKREPRQENLLAIAQAYNVDPAWLMGMDVPMVSERKQEDVPESAESILSEIKIMLDNNKFVKSTDEKRLIEYYRRLTDTRKEAILNMVKTLNDD